jgi:Tol biopolymer transport system component
MPAISPDGRMLAYVAWTDKIYPPNTPARDMPPIPEAIVVRNLAAGTVRRWAFTSDVPAITSLSWSPDSRFLSYTSLS